MIPTLYITRNELLEPLGQSQVFAYLRGLSRSYQITLITYEKDEDRIDTTRMAATHAECERLGIRWLPQRFKSWPKVIAPALSMLRMVWLVRREVRHQGVSLIHARSYIPAAVAMIVSRLTGVPFIFDMRALWPEELITVGRLKRGSLLHRAIAATEKACLKNADAVISLTHAAVHYLQEIYLEELQNKRISVIPTCADLERFRPSVSPNAETTIHSCIGTVLSGWFRTDWLSAWFHTVASRNPNVSFEIVTRDNPSEVRAVLDPENKIGVRLWVGQRSVEEMPPTINRHTVSAMFFSEGVGKLGSSPTRMAEILGCGLPVVANKGVGDVARIIQENRVGVLVKGPDQTSMNAAYDELLQLMKDPDLAKRCRTTAEVIFSLDTGTEKYRQVYESILEKTTL